MPLKEVIDDILNTIYSKDAKSSFFTDNNIKRCVLKHMLQICSESIFLYNNHVYKQQDGVAMGSLLAPLLAEWFVAKMEINIFNRKLICRPLFYKRYVDDIFAIFRTTTERDQFHDLLNSWHPNLVFTMETSTHSVPFLDTAISIKNEQFDCKVFRKPTNTGMIMNYHCTAPFKWKTSLIKCFLMRAYRVSSNFDNFNKEVMIIKNTFANNSYPESFTTRYINEFISHHKIDNTSFPKPPTNFRQEDQQNTTYLAIPYLGKPSIRFQNKLQRNLSKYDVQVKVAFRTTKVGSYFNLKTRSSRLFKSNVVYQFKCTRDENTSYIGESKRHLFTRISEHCKSDKNSAIFNHFYSCSDCQNVINIANQFTILQTCTVTTVLSTEAMLITKYKPSLNTQLGASNGAMVSLQLYQ